MRQVTVTGIALFVLIKAASVMAAEVEAVSRIDAVTVFPSGAEVKRVASINIQQGEHTVVFRDLPAETVLESIRVEAVATGRMQIASVGTKRVFVLSNESAETNAKRKELEDALNRLKDERNDLEAKLEAADLQKTLLTNLTQLPQQPPPAQGEAAPIDWQSILSLITTASADAQRAKSDANIRLRDLDEKILDVEKQISELAPAEQQRTEVRIYIDAGAPLEGDLAVRYQVPSASWTALYDGRLVTGGKAIAPKLEFVRRAAISQSSGEPWDQVAITLSTTRPTAGASAPELQPTTVDYAPEPRPMAAAPPEAMVGGFADEESDLAMAQKKARGARREMKVAAKPVTAKVVKSPFQALYEVPGRATVPSTGEAKRVLIALESSEPSLVVQTVPKSDTKAYLYAKMVVPQGSPVLAGAISLFRDDTYVGTGEMPVLAPGDEHDLGFGIDDLVRVRHSVEQEKRGETGLISTSSTDNRSYKITIKNLHERAIDVTVHDQVPDSKNNEIKVEMTGSPAPSRKNIDDKRGVVAWDMKLEPDEERSITFGYRVTWPSARSIVYGR